MAAFDMNGAWAGEYSYDPSPSLSTELPIVRFTLAAEIGWFGHLTGTVRDDPERGIPVPATIDGKVAGTLVTFQKQYPVFYVYDGERSITLTESVEKQGIVMDQEILPAPVRYRGEYDPDTMEIHGTWEIGPRRIAFRSHGQLMAANSPGARGTWWMRRQYG
jgi:hypothetical protein